MRRRKLKEIGIAVALLLTAIYVGLAIRTASAQEREVIVYYEWVLDNRLVYQSDTSDQWTTITSYKPEPPAGKKRKEAQYGGIQGVINSSNNMVISCKTAPCFYILWNYSKNPEPRPSVNHFTQTLKIVTYSNQEEVDTYNALHPYVLTYTLTSFFNLSIIQGMVSTFLVFYIASRAAVAIKVIIRAAGYDVDIKDPDDFFYVPSINDAYMSPMAQKLREKEELIEWLSNKNGRAAYLQSRMDRYRQAFPEDMEDIE